MAAHPHAEHPHGSLENVDTAHETSDINVRAIIWFVGVLTGIAVAIQIAMWGMFRVLQHYERANEPYVTPLARTAGEAPPEPRLQTTPWMDLKRFRAEQQDYLHSYGWVDEKLGVARIPIDKAKTMLLQRGIPVRPELGEVSEGTHVAATGESNGGARFRLACPIARACRPPGRPRPPPAAMRRWRLPRECLRERPRPAPPRRNLAEDNGE